MITKECSPQAVWIRSVCVSRGLDWASVSGGSRLWGRIVLSAVTCATVRRLTKGRHSGSSASVYLSTSLTVTTSPIWSEPLWGSCWCLVPVTEPLEDVSTPTPPQANIKIKMVPRGKVVGFRCGTKTQRSPPKVRSGHVWCQQVQGWIGKKKWVTYFTSLSRCCWWFSSKHMTNSFMSLPVSLLAGWRPVTMVTVNIQRSD